MCRDLEITDFYVGHTTDFRRRKTQHKNTCQNPNATAFNSYVYDFVRQHGGWDNWDMVLIERCNCEDALDARKKERQYIETLHSTLNSSIPSRTKQESNFNYRLNNKEQISVLKKQNYINNREHILNRVKEYKSRNNDKISERNSTKVECQCGGCYTLSHKPRHLQTHKHQAYLQSLIPEPAI